MAIEATEPSTALIQNDIVSWHVAIMAWAYGI